MLRLTVAAIGRLRGDMPERALIEDYHARAVRTGRGLGIGPILEHEIEPKAPGREAEGAALWRAVPQGALLIALDERGEGWSSPDLAQRIAGARDAGRADMAFLIGGADGLDPALVARADHRLSFGRLVWPHALARVMLFEQIYRATTILSGSPYHRA